MKLINAFAAAGLIVASLGASTAVSAQQYQGNGYGNDGRDHGRGDDRGYGEGRHDGGRNYGYRRGRHHCHVERHHHHDVRVCR